MVKLYRYDKEKKAWVFVDYGVRSKVREYTMQGYMVVYLQKGEAQCSATLTGSVTLT